MSILKSIIAVKEKLFYNKYVYNYRVTTKNRALVLVDYQEITYNRS